MGPRKSRHQGGIKHERWQIPASKEIGRGPGKAGVIRLLCKSDCSEGEGEKVRCTCASLSHSLRKSRSKTEECKLSTKASCILQERVCLISLLCLVTDGERRLGGVPSVPSQQLGPPRVVLPAWKSVRHVLTAIPGLGEALCSAKRSRSQRPGEAPGSQSAGHSLKYLRKPKNLNISLLIGVKAVEYKYLCNPCTENQL